MAKSTRQTIEDRAPKTPPATGVPDHAPTLPVSVLEAGRRGTAVSPGADAPKTAITGFRPAAQKPRIDLPAAFQDRCDLCDGMLEGSPGYRTDGDAQLCEHCFKQFNALPQGKIRQCLERFMLGNVV